MAYRPSEGRNQKKASPPVQPNLVPIMNLFLGIIPFLMMMVVITEVAMVSLNFSASGGGGSGDGGGGAGGASKEIKIVIMNSEGLEMFPGFEIKDTDGTKTAVRNSENKGNYNFIALDRKLNDIKNRNSDVNDITIVVYPDVKYGALIQTIDLSKKNGFPKSAGVSYGSGG